MLAGEGEGRLSDFLSALAVVGTKFKKSSSSVSCLRASMFANGLDSTGAGLLATGALVRVLLFLSSSLSSSKPVANGSLPLRRAVCTRNPEKCRLMS